MQKTLKLKKPNPKPLVKTSIIPHPVTQLLLFDIETVAQFESYSEMDDRRSALWVKFAERWPDLSPEIAWQQKAAFYAEFSKVCAISMGLFHKITKTGVPVRVNEPDPIKIKTNLRIKSFYGDDEVEIIRQFAEMLDDKTANNLFLCGHNIIEFDIPFLVRRCVINQMAIPDKINFIGKKPWDIDAVDTMNIWKFGAYRYNASLDNIAACVGVPSPKDEMSGEQVYFAYYEGKRKEISDYCDGDIVALANIIRKLKGEEFIESTNIVKAE